MFLLPSEFPQKRFDSPDILWQNKNSLPKKHLTKGHAMIFLENKLNYDEYFTLRQSVGWNNFSKDQTLFALSHTLYSVTVKSAEETVAMGRLIGDGMYFTIVDVVVRPDFQHQRIGSAIVNKLLNYVENNTPSGGRSSVFLTAEKGKESFYETLGFKRIPHEFCGSGMRKAIRTL